MSWESQSIALLSASLLRPFVLAAAAFLILWIFRVRHPASRHSVWTAVLAGMLVLPFVSVMAPHWTVPVLPSKQKPSVPAQLRTVPLQAGAISETPRSIETLQTPPKAAFEMPSMETLVEWTYLAGFFAMAAYRAMGWLLLRRVIWRSRALRGPLRESADVVVPVAAGLLRSVVILPVGWREWSLEVREAVLAHEFAHLRRNDVWVSALARIVKCLFWFHPLAWWVSRKVSELAEQACDAAALEVVGDPAGYSRVLLQFAGEASAVGYRASLPGLAMADSSGLGTRIDQVFALSSGKLRRLRRPGVVLALMGMPVMCLAATVGLGESKARQVLLAPQTPAIATPLIAQAQPVRAAKPAVIVAPANSKLEFEIASMKVAGPPVNGELCWGGCGGLGSPYPESQNQILYRHFTLKKILMRAFGVKDFQISGPGSLDTAVYDIAATAAPGTTLEQFQLMMQNLLAEQLNLKFHYETKDFISSYDLLVSSDGPKLQETPSAPDRLFADLPGVLFVNVQGGGFMVLDNVNNGVPNAHAATSISTLARVLAAVLRTPVADRTGLTGTYDIDYRQYTLSLWVPGTKRPEEPVLQSLQAALQPLGLTLEEKRVPLDVVVVDYVDAVPSGK